MAMSAAWLAWSCWHSIFWGNILSEKAKRHFKKANIGIAWGALVLLVGFPFLHGSAEGTQALALCSFLVSMVVPFILDWREERAHDKRRSRGL